MSVKAFVVCYSFSGRITLYAETAEQAGELFNDLDVFDLFENAKPINLTGIIRCPDSCLNKSINETSSDTMKHCNCPHFDLNDIFHCYGTCEILDEDFHISGECVCPPGEKRLVEALQAERDAKRGVLNP